MFNLPIPHSIIVQWANTLFKNCSMSQYTTQKKVLMADISFNTFNDQEIQYTRIAVHTSLE